MQKIQLDNTNDAPRGPSEVVSHYLEAIYYIWAEGEPVKSARLADWLSVSRPTVTVALRRMTRDGMVRFNARKDIELTAKGRRMAEAIVRRHRVMERWLTDALGFDWVTADAEAARLEHAVSEVAGKRLYNSLGRRVTTPHRTAATARAVAAREAATTWPQPAQRRASFGISLRHSGHFFVVGSAGGSLRARAIRAVYGTTTKK